MLATFDNSEKVPTLSTDLEKTATTKPEVQVRRVVLPVAAVSLFTREATF
jgi:hypothetical protein